ncbi:MAG: hypothetical protein WAT12_16285 [Candidatus Nitrotoga sp.]
MEKTRVKRPYVKFEELFGPICLPEPEKTVEEKEVGEEEGRLNLSDAIKKNYSRLENIFSRYVFYTYLQPQLRDYKNFTNYRNEITKQIDNKDITEQSVNDAKCINIEIEREEKSVSSLWLSCVFTVIAERADQAGDNCRGWALIVHACYYAGRADLHTSMDRMKHNFIKQSKQGRKASLARDRKNENVKREAIRLLRDLAPEGGWVTKTSAIKGIEDRLYDFIKKVNSNLASSKEDGSDVLVQWLTKWINLDLAMGDAFTANSKKGD